MKKILTASQMKEYDTYTINELGIPSMVLMERAALAVFHEIQNYISDTSLKPAKTKVLVVCGGGNNGGDGLAIARLLMEFDLKPDVVLLGEELKRSKECKEQLSILEKMGLSVRPQIDFLEYDIIVDAIFGIGLHRPLEGEWRKCIEMLNRMCAFKIAVDIPSGLDADTGCIQGVAFKADLTVTFEYYKRGLFQGQGPLYTGRVLLRSIGITKSDLIDKSELLYTFDEDIKELLPYRDPNGNKGTFGKVYIYAGSEETMGAAILCAKSAFYAGAGMVKVLCPKKYVPLFLETIPEVILSPYDSASIDNIEEVIKADLEWADAAVIGPGIGTGHVAYTFLQIFLRCAKVPMVMDADALNLLSQHECLKSDLLSFNQIYQRTVIMTPHVGELSRLLEVSVKEIKEHAYEQAVLLSKTYDCIAVCKDAKTLVCFCGEAGYLNLSGNHGMATAGSGDVLTGILGAYVAIGKEPYKNVQKAVYLHGCAGDKAAEKVGERALLASHIIEGMVALQKGN